MLRDRFSRCFSQAARFRRPRALRAATLGETFPSMGTGSSRSARYCLSSAADENPVESYLCGRGWRARALTPNYMAALQTSVMSPYEVSDIRPGQAFKARASEP